MGRLMPRKCGFPGCVRTHHSAGYCAAHSKQKQRGYPLTPVRDYAGQALSAGDVDLAWLAGLLEGEGSFFAQISEKSTHRPRLVVTLSMTDRDVVARAREMMHCRTLLVERRKRQGRKQAYRAQANGAQAEEVMRAVRPYMGQRRGAKIDELLAMEGLSHHPRRSA